MGDSNESAAPRRRWIRRLIAWGVTVAVIVFLLTRYSPAEIASALVRGNWAAMIPIIFATSLWALFFMATADWLLFSAALGKIRWVDALRGKAGCSVLQALNHTVGQGAYGVWLARKTRSGLSETVGVMGLVIVTDLIALFLIVGAAVWFTDPSALPRGQVLRWLAPAIVVGLAAAGLILPRLLPKLTERGKMFTPWRRVEPLLFGLIIAVRVISVTGVMIGTWAAARFFGLPFPLSSFLAYLPIIILAGALPINVLGFGAVQLVWVEAFKPWATEPEILAFQFLSQVMAIAAFIIRGAPFLPSVLRDISPERDLGSDSPSPTT